MTINEHLRNIQNFIYSGNTRYQILAFLGLVVYVVLFYVLTTNINMAPQSLTIANSIFITTLIGSIVFLNVRFSGSDTLKNRFINVVMNTGYVILGITIVYVSLKFLSESTFAMNTFSYIFMIASVVGAMYLVYILLNKTPFVQYMKQYPLFSLLYHFIFLIPCYIFEGSAFLYNTIKTTKLYIFRIFVMVLLFITAWFMIPYLERKINYNGIPLLVKPAYTNKQSILKPPSTASTSNSSNTFASLHTFLSPKGSTTTSQTTPQTTPQTTHKDVPYRYALSCWVFIDNQGGNTSSTSDVLTPLLSYGNKTAILYNSSTNVFQITTKKGIDGKEVIYSSSTIPIQKWNNIIINYDSGTVDVFINKELVATKNDIIPFVTHDTVIVGHDNGVNGGIRNVTYYTAPLNKVQIDWAYSSEK